MRSAPFVLLALAAPAFPQQYTITDLGSLASNGESHATAINASGQVAGFSQSDVQRRYSHAVRREPAGTTTDLGLLSGLPARVSYGWGINDLGHVVGASEKTVGATLGTKPFVHRNGAMVELTTPANSASGYGFAINNAGQIAGSFDFGILQLFGGGRVFHAAIWTNNQMQDLGTLGGRFSHARAINNLGHAVGGALGNSLPMHAFVFRSGVMSDLGTLGGTTSEARDINDAGQIVGWSTNAGNARRAFLHSSGVMTDLGALGTTSEAYAISASGVVVGTTWIAGAGPRAFIKLPGHAMQDLNTLANDPAWTLQYARDVNGMGQIVGVGRNGGRNRGFLLTPSSTLTGACCMAGGTCAADLTTSACAAAGGIAWAPNTPCAQAQCPQPGACCMPDGTCTVSFAAACASAGGTPAAGGVACAQTNCPQPGACCYPDGSCSTTLIISECAARAGVFRGLGTACTSCPRAYPYSGPPVPIPDGSGSATCGPQAIAAVVVNDSFPISSADASFFVTHGWQGDLRFTLRHVETGTTVRMVDRPGHPQISFGFGVANYGNAAASAPVPFRSSGSGAQVYDRPPLLVNGIANVSGLWRPENSLAVFVGENSAGTWQLIAEDCASSLTGSITAWTLNLGRPPACYANCDGSTIPPVLNVGDFTCFLQRFAAADPYANCDQSTTPPILNIGDFTCFLQSFAAGCP
jgi:probable HAF family extracellular repeat protein